MTIEQAKQLCLEAHKGQWRRPRYVTSKELSYFKNKAKKPFTTNEILPDGNRYEAVLGTVTIQKPFYTHPFAVADMMNTDEEKIVAYLHDVVEDCDNYYLNSANRTICNNSGLNMQLSEKEFTALISLAHEKHIPYNKYVERIATSKNIIAIKIKLADMFHNISSSPSDKQKAKYLGAIPILLKALQ